MKNKTLRHLKLQIPESHLTGALIALRLNHGLKTLDMMKIKLPKNRIQEIEDVKNVKIFYYDDRM